LRLNFKIQKQRQVFHGISRQEENITEATKRIAYIVGRKGKPYTEIKR